MSDGQINPRLGVPVWRQLADILRAQIEAGQPPRGELLPSIRQLQQMFEVSDSSVKHALAQLRADGIIGTVNGKGSYVL